MNNNTFINTFKSSFNRTVYSAINDYLALGSKPFGVEKLYFSVTYKGLTKRSHSLRLALFACLFCLIWSQNVLSSTLNISIPNVQWWEEVRQGNDKLATKLGLSVPPEVLISLAKVRSRMLSDDQKGFTVGLLPSNEVNAFAKKEGGYTLVIFTSGFLLRFGNDPDVLATTLGHEMAHHILGHTNTSSDKAAGPLYMLTNHSHDKPGSHKHSSVESKRDLEAKALAKQTLDNERQADLLGMQWAIKAGYSACGSYRLAQGLEELKSGISSAVNLASHPTNNERMQIAQQFEHLENRSTNCMADTSENNFMISATETLYLHAVEDAIY